MRLMNCGDERLSRPSMGAWITYGLGTENQNLPGFIAMCPGLPVADVSNWRSAFLPGVYQGTYIDTRHSNVDELIENIRNTTVTQPDQRRQLDLLADLNRRHQRAPGRGRCPRGPHRQLRAGLSHADGGDRRLRRQPGAAIISTDAYGPGVQARQLLIARRLIERGVRFVQLYHGDVQPWDSHDHIAENHRNLAGQCDQAIAALLTDLKQRGLFDETLVLCGGEFGRTPAVEMVNWASPAWAATTTTGASPSGWPAAASRAARSTAPPTSSATKPSRTRSTSTTCTPRSCICSASTTPGSPTATPAATSG